MRSIQSVRYCINGKEHNIYTGNNIVLSVLNDIKEQEKERCFLIVCDKSLKGKSVINQISNIFNSDIEFYKIDSTKNVSSAIDLLRVFKKRNVLRNTIIICIGGGTLGDICGFASSIYMRGIDYIQVGTTLMSQLDCIVQKVAVCDVGYKNIYGSFHSPVATINDTSVLYNKVDLSDFVEAIKHVLVSETSYVEYESYIKNLYSISNSLPNIIHRSVQTKTAFVLDDLFDTNGKQKSLSLGHTFANVIESSCPNISHSHAVWIGIGIALKLSEKEYGLHRGVYKLFSEIRSFLCPDLPKVRIEKNKVQTLLQEDKLSFNGQIHIVLLKKLGRHIVSAGFSYAKIEKVLLSEEHVIYT